MLPVVLCMTGVTLLGNHYHDEYVAADGNDESDDSDDGEPITRENINRIYTSSSVTFHKNVPWKKERK